MESAESNWGKLLVAITSGEVTEELKGKEKEIFIAEIHCPRSVGEADSHTVTTTKKAQADMGEWSASMEIDMKKSIEECAPLTITVFEVGIINRSVGKGQLYLDCLMNGGRAMERINIVGKVGGLFGGGGKEVIVATVAVSLQWSGDTPPYLRHTTVDSLAKANNEASASVSGGQTKGKISGLIGKSAPPPPPPPPPLPECEGRAFSIRVIAHKARNLQSEDDNKEYNPFVSVTVGEETRKTEADPKTLNPYFDDEMMIMVPKAEGNFWTTPIQINVMHKPFIGPSRLIGMGQMDMGVVYRCPNHFMQNKWLVLRKGEMSTQIMGFLKVSVMVLDAVNDTIPEMESEDEDDDEDEEEMVMGLLNAPGAAYEEVYMRCEIYKADDVPRMDMGLTGGLCDPLVKINYGVKKTQVAHKINTLSPVWNTATSLAALLPSMTDNIVIEMWDYDSIGSNEIIATHKLSFNSLLAHSTSGLPLFPARYINLYGSPSNVINTLNDAYFLKMDRGLKPPVDYRGRLLLGIIGTRDKAMLSGSIAPIQEAVVQITVNLQANHFSMLPVGKYTLKLVCGNLSSQTPEFEVTKMSYTTKLGGPEIGAALIQKEMKVRGNFNCVCRRLENTLSYASVIEQIPDVFLQIIQEKKLYASARVRTGDLITNDPTNRYKYFSLNFTTMADPDKVKEGKAPAAPLGQFYVSMSAKVLEYMPPLDDDLTFERVQGTLGSDMLPIPKNSEKDGSYRLEICVYHARQVPSGDSNGLSDPYVRICWADASATTCVREETLSPSFNELLILNATAVQKFPDVIIELWDWDRFGGNTFLARALVPFEKITAMSTTQIEYADGRRTCPKEWIGGFKDSRGRAVDSDVLLSIEVMRTHSSQKRVRFPGKIRGPDGKTGYEGFLIPSDKALQMQHYRFCLSIFSLRKMRKYRFLEIKAPTVEIECGGYKCSTEKKPGPNPDINEKIEFVVELPTNPRYLPQLNIKVYDRRLGSKTLVGSSIINMDDDKYDPTKLEDLRAEANELVKKNMMNHLIRKEGIINKMRPVIAVTTKSKPKTLKKSSTNVLSMNRVVRLFSGGKGKVSDPVDEGSGGGSEELGVSSPNEPFAFNADDSYTTVTRAGDGPLDCDAAVDMFNDDREKEFDRVADNPYSEDEAEEAKKQPSPEVEELEVPWFDRFDPTEPDQLMPHELVSRLHKLVDNPKDSTCEKQFGPFNDEYDTIELYRGWGKKRIKAGEVNMTFTLEPTREDLTRFEVKPTTLLSRKDVEFCCRVYIMSCSHLAAKDNSIFGSSSDPYPVLTLSDGSDTCPKERVVKVICKDDKKLQTLNPEYFIMREISGKLPQHSNLRLEIYDWDMIGSDELIGFTDINLEERWFSSRGYSITTNQKEGGTLCPGSYTEKRDLRDNQGQVQGRVELWVDVFPTKAKLPLPISVAPYPPIQMEFRVIVWAVRDCVLQDVSVHGEAMTDIYVKCWMNGMRNDMQETDVHYRSLDGSGTFNWRMIFPFVFDPRSKKIMPVTPGGGLASFFRIRKEQKKLEPALKVQIFDNDLFPGTDDFIGETSLNILKMRPTNTRRITTNIMDEFVEDVRSFCSCCFKKKRSDDMSLEEKQAMAVAEFKEEMKVQRKEWNAEADRRLEGLKSHRTNGVPTYSFAQLEVFRKQFYNEARRKSLVNALEVFTPKIVRQKKDKDGGGAVKPPTAAAGAASQQASQTNKTTSTVSTDSEIPYEDTLPQESYTARYWFACRGPKGACRVGDVQLQFGAVRTKAMREVAKLEAGRGRQEPQSLPPPNRPESSFFFLSSPYKAAIHILWKNYKWYIITFLCILFLLFLIYAFVNQLIQVQTDNLFDVNPKPPDVVIVQP